MKKSRNDVCECGSGKKYKNCCLIDHGESFFQKYGNKIFLVGFFSFLSWAFYVKFINVEPTVWCYECNRYVLESSSGHQLEPLEK